MVANLKSIFFLIVFSTCSLFVFSQTREELEKRRKEIQQEIQELQKAQSEISKDKKAGLSQLKLIERKLKSRYYKLPRIRRFVHVYLNLGRVCRKY